MVTRPHELMQQRVRGKYKLASCCVFLGGVRKSRKYFGTLAGGCKRVCGVS